MTISTRIAPGLSAAVVSLSLALAPAAFAQDKMGKDDGMKKDSMSKDSRRSQPIDATLYLRRERWSVGWNGDFIEVLPRQKRRNCGTVGSAGSH